MPRRRPSMRPPWLPSFRPAACGLGVLVLLVMLAPAPAVAVPFAVTLTPTYDVVLGWHVYRDLNGNVVFSLVDAGLPTPSFPAGQTTTLQFEGGLPPGASPYLFFGLYDDGGSRGVVASLRDASAITAGLTYEDVFPGFSETTMQILLQSFDDGVPESGLIDHPSAVYEAHGSVVGPSVGTEGQLVAFSTASDGGTIKVEVVPEAGLATLLLAACVSLLPRRTGRSPRRGAIRAPDPDRCARATQRAVRSRARRTAA